MEAQKLNRFINNLVEISRLESGLEAIRKEPVVLRDILASSLKSLHPLISKQRFAIQMQKDFPLLKVNPALMELVFLNLLENAIKYGRQNGNITASVYKTDGEHVLIEISDDGIGILEEHLPRIFERFYRTDTARSRKIGGSGLGLAICKHIIEAHGQSIHVRSKEDVGTTFGFVLDGKREASP